MSASDRAKLERDYRRHNAVQISGGIITPYDDYFRRSVIEVHKRWKSEEWDKSKAVMTLCSVVNECRELTTVAKFNLYHACQQELDAYDDFIKANTGV